ncbi:MAG: hypothetical protein VCE75_10145, partial [Alphaproteobacteria bacterium]
MTTANINAAALNIRLATIMEKLAMSSTFAAYYCRLLLPPTIAAYNCRLRCTVRAERPSQWLNPRPAGKRITNFPYFSL